MTKKKHEGVTRTEGIQHVSYGVFFLSQSIGFIYLLASDSVALGFLRMRITLSPRKNILGI